MKLADVVLTSQHEKIVTTYGALARILRLNDYVSKTLYSFFRLEEFS